MVIQLATGRVIEISVKQYLDMSDDEFSDEMADVANRGHGICMEDPFFRSSFTNKEESTRLSDEEKEWLEDNEVEPSLDQINSIEKFKSLDLPDYILME